VEFVRWYRETGGLSGPVLFTSFEQHKPLPRVLDELGRMFEGVLAKNVALTPAIRIRIPRDRPNQPFGIRRSAPTDAALLMATFRLQRYGSL
jgi:hypothetical protein